MATREKMKDGSTRILGASLSLSDVLLALNPIGSIYMTVDPTDPGTIFGGTWTAWGSGRVPVGIDGTQPEFDGVEETGGAKLQTISIAQMPLHDHGGATEPSTVSGTSALGIASTNPAGSARYTRGDTTTTGTNDIQGSSHTHAIDAQGSGLGHNNLQPYITCYMWKRTA